MRLPLFWAKEEARASKSRGGEVRFSVWRWSEIGLDEARARARAAIAEIRHRIETGRPFPDRYAYTSRPVREEVLRRFPGDSGELTAAITRNAYGALVLNTARVMFVDSDDAHAGPGWLSRLLGRKPVEDAALARARALVQADSKATVRIYRTKAGVRYLLTHDLFDPASDETRGIMERLGADPKYAQLCKVQESFRARVTPKPWRCGIRPPTVRWPWSDPESEAAMREWVSRYEQACQRLAVCSLVATMGSARTHPEVAPLVHLHDELTGVGKENPLA